jgi:hypothetical protein
VFWLPQHALHPLARNKEIRWVQLGNSIGVTQSFAGSPPSNRGNDGSTHILVRTRQHTERYARNRPFRTRKNVPLFHKTMRNRGEWVMARLKSFRSES